MKHLLLIPILIAVFACEKEKVQSQDSIFSAPCVINEKSHQLDSVFFEGDEYDPQAKYRVRFYDTVNTTSNIGYYEFGFNQIPKSGKYHLVTIIDSTNLLKPNQMYFKWKYGSFHIRPANSEYPDVFVNKTDKELLISFCEMEMGDTLLLFDLTTASYIDSNLQRFKIRKTY